MESVRSALRIKALPNSTKISAPENPLSVRLPLRHGVNQNSYRACSAAVIRLQRTEKRMLGLVCMSSAPKATEFEENGCGSGCAGSKKKLAVFVSGGGSNFRAIHEAAMSGNVHGVVAVVVTDKPGCGGAEYARDNGIPVIIFPKSNSSADGLSPTDLVNTLRRFEINFVLLAGYLKLIPVDLVQAYPRSILNIHPSLLPAFGGKGYYGLKVHKAVIAFGASIIGCSSRNLSIIIIRGYSGPTVHFVDEHYDTGRTLAQRVVPVLANDTAEQLAARVLHEEHQVYVEAVSALCEDRIVWRADGVPLIRSRDNPDEYT